MEALRTKVDSLKWEVHRLDAENHKLRLERPELVEQLDLEQELERAKEDMAGASSQCKVYRQKINEAEQ